jgi:uncharacterized protein (DUF2336 family)
MIVQNVSEDGKTTDITFTVPAADYERAAGRAEARPRRRSATRREGSTDVAKVSVIGIGMRSHAGVAAEAFQALAGKGINIRAITTSEIKISVLIDAAYTELAVRTLHSLYGLDNMGLLIDRIERQALVELSGRLSDVDNAPAGVIGRLSQNDDIEIAGPILERSPMLTEGDLIAIAATKSQAHLASIAGREQITEGVTDVLIDRGDADVARKVTENTGAKFSEAGFAKAVTRAEQDESLAVAIANRVELPPDLLDRLVRKATDTVRKKLMAGARPELRERIAQVLTAVAEDVARKAAPSFRYVNPLIRKDPVLLRERIAQCAQDGDTDGLIDALATLCEMPDKTVNDLIRQSSEEAILVLGRASGLAWPQVQKILTATMPDKVATPESAKSICTKYVNLTSANAARAARFIRQSATKSAEELRKLVWETK